MEKWLTFFQKNILKILLIYLFMAALGLRCYTRAFSSCGERGLLFVAVRGLLIAVASLVAEHGLQAHGLQQLWLAGSRAQAQQWWPTGLVAPQHVGLSQNRARTCVPCIGGRILNHYAAREARNGKLLSQKGSTFTKHLYTRYKVGLIGKNFTSRDVAKCTHFLEIPLFHKDVCSGQA